MEDNLKKYFTDAFKRDLLLEQDFNANDIHEIRDFMDDDRNDEEDDYVKEVAVMDPEAYIDDDIKDSYEGMYILKCPICGTLFYKAPEDVIVGEDGNFANVDEPCPVCQPDASAAKGFLVIGKVADIKDSDIKKDDDDLELEDSEPEEVDDIDLKDTPIEDVNDDIEFDGSIDPDEDDFNYSDLDTLGTDEEDIEEPEEPEKDEEAEDKSDNQEEDEKEDEDKSKKSKSKKDKDDKEKDESLKKSTSDFVSEDSIKLDESAENSDGTPELSDEDTLDIANDIATESLSGTNVSSDSHLLDEETDEETDIAEVDDISPEEGVGIIKATTVDMDAPATDDILVDISNAATSEPHEVEDVPADESLSEDFRNASFDTDKEHVDLSVDATGHVQLNSEPINEPGTEEIVPLDNADIAQIDNNGAEEEQANTLGGISDEIRPTEGAEESVEGEEPIEGEIPAEGEESGEEPNEEEENLENLENESFDWLANKLVKGLNENINTFESTRVVETSTGIKITGVTYRKDGKVLSESFELSNPRKIKGTNTLVFDGKTSIKEDLKLNIICSNENGTLKPYRLTYNKSLTEATSKL